MEGYGLIRFSKKTGKLDTLMTCGIRSMLDLWALQNCTASNACIIFSLEDGTTLREYDGRKDFPLIRKDASAFVYDLSPEIVAAAIENERGRTTK